NHVCGLQRSDDEITLADAEADGLTGKPHLVGGILEASLLPCGAWQDAFALAADVDVGRLAEPEMRQPARELVDAHHRGELVEVHVAGLRDGGFHRDHAVAARAPVAVSMAGSRQIEIAWAKLGPLRGRDAEREAAERNRRFHGG